MSVLGVRKYLTLGELVGFSHGKLGDKLAGVGYIEVPIIISVVYPARA
jgi:hypothetical protein